MTILKTQGYTDSMSNVWFYCRRFIPDSQRNSSFHFFRVIFTHFKQRFVFFSSDVDMFFSRDVPHLSLKQRWRVAKSCKSLIIILDRIAFGYSAYYEHKKGLANIGSNEEKVYWWGRPVVAELALAEAAQTIPMLLAPNPTSRRIHLEKKQGEIFRNC